MRVPSGTVTSAINCALSQAEGGTVTGPGVVVTVAVGGVPVTVGGGDVTPWRAMIGLPHRARSPTAEPQAEIYRMNLTVCPANGVRSRFGLYVRPSYLSRKVQKVRIVPPTS